MPWKEGNYWVSWDNDEKQVSRSRRLNWVRWWQRSWRTRDVFTPVMTLEYVSGTGFNRHPPAPNRYKHTRAQWWIKKNDQIIKPRWTHDWNDVWSQNYLCVLIGGESSKLLCVEVEVGVLIYRKQTLHCQVEVVVIISHRAANSTVIIPLITMRLHAIHIVTELSRYVLDSSEAVLLGLCNQWSLALGIFSDILCVHDPST